jgi:hypothetical protein
MARRFPDQGRCQWTETERNNDKLATSSNSTRLSRWIGEQLTILAEAMGESLSRARLQIYAADLADLEKSQLETAFGRARRELKFFPKIAELRDLAGVAAAKDTRNVEAEAAWKWANGYLRKWGVDLLPIYCGGTRTNPPALPSRIDYALRRIGGLRGLNQITEESRPFMFRDFCEAYNLAPIADSLALQLAGKFPISEGKVKQLTDGALAEQSREAIPVPVPRVRPKPIPHQQPLTAAQCADRREMLKQQAAGLRFVKESAREIGAAPDHSEHTPSLQAGRGIPLGQTPESGDAISVA